MGRGRDAGARHAAEMVPARPIYTVAHGGTRRRGRALRHGSQHALRFGDRVLPGLDAVVRRSVEDGSDLLDDRVEVEGLPHVAVAPDHPAMDQVARATLDR